VSGQPTPGASEPYPSSRGIEHAIDLDATLLRVHGELKELLARGDLDASVRASLGQALANISLAAQDLGLTYEMLYDHGI